MTERAAEQYAFASIGRAVLAAQLFELVLIVLSEGAKMWTEEVYLQETGGLISDETFKTAVTVVLRDLAKRGSIATDLKERIASYSEQRNILIHRWVRLYGWPGPDDENGLPRLIAVANFVEHEAKSLTKLLTDYAIRFGRPDSIETNPEDYRRTMGEIFQRAHLEPPLTPEQIKSISEAFAAQADAPPRKHG